MSIDKVGSLCAVKGGVRFFCELLLRCLKSAIAVEALRFEGALAVSSATGPFVKKGGGDRQVTQVRILGKQNVWKM